MLDALTQHRAIFPEKREISPWLEAGFFYSADNRQLNYNISTQAHLRGRRGVRFFVIFGVYA